jgi:probable pyridine nucleotide-disulfide oxidoreductase
MKKTEFAIIGFGKAGKTLAAKLGTLGYHVILIEKDPKMYGGTCINVACIPTKALVEQALLSAKLGGSFEEKSKRFASSMAKKESLTGALRDKNYHKLADNPNIEVLDGTASFIDNHHLEVVGKVNDTIEADTIIVNTGSRPFVPPFPGGNSSRVFTSESLLNNLKKLPPRLLIIGGGYIGLEFASMFLNFGSQVAMVQTEALFLPREDRQMAEALEKDFRARGLELYKNASTQGFSDYGEKVVAHVGVDEQDLDLEADAVLIATGRRPNLEGLHVEKAGIALTERGAIKVDEHLRTTQPNIYAAGDVVGGLQFTYVSLDDSRIILNSLLGGERSTLNRGFVPYSVFIDPPFSRIGLSEEEAKAHYEIMVGSLPAIAIPKALILEKPQGLLKAIVDKRTHAILGVHLYCAESPEMINLVKLAMDSGLPYERLRDAIYTHPTMSEAFNDLFATVK